MIVLHLDLPSWINAGALLLLAIVAMPAVALWMQRMVDEWKDSGDGDE